MVSRRQILVGGAATIAASGGSAQGQILLPPRKFPRRPPIAGVATAVTALVGRTVSGPFDTPTRVSSLAMFMDIFGAVSDAFPLARAVADFFDNGGQTAVILRLFVPDAHDGYARLSIGAVDLRAASPGAWGNALTAIIDTVVPHPQATSFTLRLRTAISAETFTGITLSDGPLRLDTVLAANSRLARWDGQWPNQLLTSLPGRSRASGGSDGLALVAGDYLGDGTKGGIHALDAEDFNLLCIPPDLAAGDTAAEVYQAALAICVRRRALLIADPPAAWQTAGDAVAGLSATGLAGATNAVLYFPRLAVVGAARSAPVTRVSCGAVAGVFARSDAARNVWAAPAGSNAVLKGETGATLDVATAINDVQATALVAANINPVRRFNGGAPLVYGARTLSGDPDYRYINVVRTAQFIENSIRAGTAWTGTAADDETTWAQLRLVVSTFLQDLFRKGAFQGTTPANAYYVRCDATTTSQADIQAGRLVLQIGFAPLKPAEFIILRITLQRPPAHVRPL